MDSLSSADPLERIDALCCEFEAAWREGNSPAMEAYLQQVDESLREELFAELLKCEVQLQQEQGQVPRKQEYLERFGQYAGIVAAVCANVVPLHGTSALDGYETIPYQYEPSGSDAAKGSNLPCRFGEYELLEKLGAGGMGVVFKARHLPADRIVALKLIRGDLLARFVPEEREAMLRRFQNEVQAAAKLEHDHIVPVYDVGQVDGQPYYTMRYIDGESLREKLADGPIDPREAAEYIAQIARAVAAAHAQTPPILHRDIKPHNVMVDAEANRALLADFGLAKIAAEEQAQELTATGLLGSPPYMSPEQTADAANVTPAADIYSLGATLYHLLTGRPPFQAASLAETIRQINDLDPVPPRQLNPAVPRDLETICLKCLRKEPERRFTSARDLADDLHRWLNNQPIKARRVSLAEKSWLWCKRRPAIASLLAAIVIILTVTATAIGVQRHQNEQQRIENERRTELAQIENDKRRVASLVASLMSSRGPIVPYAIDDLEDVPREMVLKELNLQFSSGDEARKPQVAYGLARFGQVDVEFLVGCIATAPVTECRNIVTALRYRKTDAVKSLHAALVSVKRPGVKVRLATVLLHLGDPTAAQAMLKLGRDPTERTAFIHHLDQFHGDLSDYVARLRETVDADFRSGLCLAVGRIAVESTHPEERQQIEQILREMYRSAPGGSTHSASDWALRQWGSERPQLEKTGDADGEDWYVNSQGMTLIRIPASSVTPDTERIRHSVKLTRDLWICDREVTKGQFERFMVDTGYRFKPNQQVAFNEFSSTGAHAAGYLTWYDAVSFCNWLSDRDGLPRCYERIEEQDSDAGEEADTNWRFVSDAHGYRLPSTAEWDVACRSRASTAYCFGDDDRWLDSYVVYDAKGMMFGGSKLPNGWGLFDMRGNAWEWCWGIPRPSKDGELRDEVGPYPKNNVALRGGAYYSKAHQLDSTARTTLLASPPGLGYGFRVARTHR